MRDALFNELVAQVAGVQGEPNPQPSRPLAGIFDRGVQLESLRNLQSQLESATKQVERAGKGR